jgi:formylmethanofuran dehydrogenase subunit E
MILNPPNAPEPPTKSMDTHHDPRRPPQKPPRVVCHCNECGRQFQERERHPTDERLLCPRCRREADQD